VAEEIGADRVGIRFTRAVATGGTDEGDTLKSRSNIITFVAALAPLGLAYLHLVQIGDEELRCAIFDTRGAAPTCQPSRSGPLGLSAMMLRPAQLTLSFAAGPF
jgi:N-ethylmaleimide reductase